MSLKSQHSLQFYHFNSQLEVYIFNNCLVVSHDLENHRFCRAHLNEKFVFLATTPVVLQTTVLPMCISSLTVYLCPQCLHHIWACLKVHTKQSPREHGGPARSTRAHADVAWTHPARGPRANKGTFSFQAEQFILNTVFTLTSVNYRAEFHRLHHKFVLDPPLSVLTSRHLEKSKKNLLKEMGEEPALQATLQHLSSQFNVLRSHRQVSCVYTHT